MVGILVSNESFLESRESCRSTWKNDSSRLVPEWPLRSGEKLERDSRWDSLFRSLDFDLELDLDFFLDLSELELELLLFDLALRFFDDETCLSSLTTCFSWTVVT